MNETNRAPRDLLPLESYPSPEPAMADSPPPLRDHETSFSRSRMTEPAPPRPLRIVPKLDDSQIDAAIEEDISTFNPIYQGYQVLHYGLSLFLLLSGIDKFLSLFADWDSLVAPQLAQAFTTGTSTLVHVVGALEIALFVGVATRPRIFAPLASVWLALMAVNHFMTPGSSHAGLLDIALAVAAFSLGRLSQVFDRTERKARFLEREQEPRDSAAA